MEKNCAKIPGRVKKQTETTKNKAVTKDSLENFLKYVSF